MNQYDENDFDLFISEDEKWRFFEEDDEEWCFADFDDNDLRFSSEFIHKRRRGTLENNIQTIYDDYFGLNISQINDYAKVDKLCPKPTKKEELELLSRKNRGDLVAREILILSNIRWVASIAIRYSEKYNVDCDDLMQEGLIALIMSLDQYEIRQGVRVSTHAIPMIRNRIVRFIEGLAVPVRLPVHMHERVTKAKRIIDRFQFQNSRLPTYNELSKLMSLSYKQVYELMVLAYDYLFPENIVCDSDDEWQSIIDDGLSLADYAQYVQLQSSLDSELHTLTPRERQIIILSFGLGKERSHTLEEIGKEFDITRERIRQIQAKALRKLRHSSRARTLKGFINYSCSEDNTYIGLPQEDYSTPSLNYIDDIYRRHRLRGWHIIEEQDISEVLKKKLRYMGFQVMEQFTKCSLSDIECLTSLEKVQLIRYLDKIFLRLTDCSVELYENIDSFLEKNIACSCCNQLIEDNKYDLINWICKSCKKRLENLENNIWFQIDDFSLTQTHLINQRIDFTCNFNPILQSETYTRFTIRDARIVISGYEKYRAVNFGFETIYSGREKFIECSKNADVKMNAYWRLSEYQEILFSNISTIELDLCINNQNALLILKPFFNKNGTLEKIESYDFILENGN